jgi:hypothetical protein
MKRALFLAVVLCAAPALASAGGAGGVGFGIQYYDPEWSNMQMGMSNITGYGYGVLRDGSRIGGFGTAMLSMQSAGGVGGLLLGHEWRSGPLVLGVSGLGGVGGGSWSGRGYMLLFGEADLELGLCVTPWMQIVAYAGYQAWGNLIPGIPFASAYLATPVIGVRIGWGGLF